MATLLYSDLTDEGAFPKYWGKKNAAKVLHQGDEWSQHFAVTCPSKETAGRLQNLIWASIMHNSSEVVHPGATASVQRDVDPTCVSVYQDPHRDDAERWPKRTIKLPPKTAVKGVQPSRRITLWLMRWYIDEMRLSLAIHLQAWDGAAGRLTALHSAQCVRIEAIL